MSQKIDFARSHALEAERQLKRLRRMVTKPEPKNAGQPVLAWRELRDSLEKLRSVVSRGLAAAAEARPEGDPARLRRKNELQARALRVEDAIRDIEAKQEAVETDRQRALSELEGVREGWRLWREEANLSAEELPEGTVDDLWEKLTALTAQWEGLMAQQGQVIQESDRIESAWRWLLTVSFPIFEAKSSSSPLSYQTAHFQEGLKDIDRRWRALRLRLKALTPLAGAVAEKDLSLEIQDSRLALLAGEIAGLKDALEEARKDARRWREIGEKASREVEGVLTTRAAKDKLTIQELRSDLSDFESQRRADEAEISDVRQSLVEAKGLFEAVERELESSKQAHQILLERFGELEKSEAESRKQADDLKTLLEEAQEMAQSRGRELAQLTETEQGEHKLISDFEEEKRALESLAASAKEGISAGEELKKKEAVEVAAFSQTVRLLEMEKASLSKEKADLEAKIFDLEEQLKLMPAEVPVFKDEASQPPLAPGKEAPAGPAAPSLEPVLDPAWSKIVKFLGEHLTASFSRLRQLAAMALAPGPQAMVRMAASSLAQANDAVKVIGEYFDDTQAAPLPGRLETVLDAALTAWEGALKSRRIVLARSVEPKLPVVLMQTEALRTAFYQILRNAYEAMPRGGHLAVKASVDAPSGQVCVSFLDTGAGIAPNVLANPFQPFANGGKGHLGIGLALARSLMHRMNGDLEAVNGPKKGAQLTFRLSQPGGTEPPALTPL